MKNQELFRGLHILETGEKYTEEMGKYPVISISLKAGKQKTFEYSFSCLKEVIADEFSRHIVALNSLWLEAERKKYMRLCSMEAAVPEYLTALAFLSKCLFSITGCLR